MTGTITTINPATEEELTSYDEVDRETAFKAIEDCHHAQQQWKLKTLEERGEVLKAIGAKLRERQEDFAQLMTKEVGKLLSDSRGEVALCANICDYTAEQGLKELADEERDLGEDGKTGLVTYQPMGVIYGIQPWNFPAYQAVRYAIANLMAGNGVLLKHAANCTGSGIFLRHVMEEAGLPEGLFSVLVISHDLSDEVIEHDLVRGVTLTGSFGSGKHVAEKAGAAMKKTVMELGSNDAYLVLDDADVDLAVKTCVKGRLVNNGETCIAAKRFIVTEKVYDEFLEKFVARMESAKMGDPTEDDTKLGPMAREDLRDGLHEQVEKSVAKGARIRCGGEIPDRKGYYYPPTVLDQVAPGMPAYDDELFGPVASVIKAVDDEDAMRIANDSRFGLGGGIFSKDVEKAKRLASLHFDTGMVFINTFGLSHPAMPFGGVKDSGYGREHGGSGMKEFINEKSLFIGT